MPRSVTVRGLVAVLLCSALIACSAEKAIIRDHNSPHTEQIEKEINLDEDAAGPPKGDLSEMPQSRSTQDKN
ncbi:hypothetical protein [Acetobacter sp.]|uniref:hypothetical protein n=1 Tax=Acetobacter sp. TaxID=440 RepID=UPI0025BC55FA|nr:hypothetical protein [Acetobacter sp.]MCH4091524.1 hypothetical protein [Acetobacter sp.]MCI1299502.1 hypothetical protein [Acetobacter sp.]MCI1316908.1 hypothetical protein [Acetobacter sp.]